MRRLIVRPGAIGDCILALPAMECLKIGYTEVWAPSPVVSLVRFADRVRSIASTGIDLLGFPGIDPPRRLVKELHSFDSLVFWYGANRPEFRECIGSLGLQAEFLPALPPADGGHAADYFLKQAGCTGRAVPRIPTPPIARRDLVVIHPFSGSAKKNWPLEQFRAVAAQIRVPVSWCVGPEQNLPGAERFDDLYDLACWIAEARLYIGNDSGITHLAAAVGTPVIALFGPTDPACWGPRGEYVRIIHQPLESITVEQVLSAAGELLNPGEDLFTYPKC